MKNKKSKRRHQNDPNESMPSSGEEQVTASGKVCPHVMRAVNIADIKRNLKKTNVIGECQSCSKDGEKVDAKENQEAVNNEFDLEHFDSVWLCLQCGNQGCSRYSSNKHALLHYETPHSDCHALIVNTSTWDIWCYECDKELVANCNKKLLESVEYLKKQSGSGKVNKISSNGNNKEIVAEDVLIKNSTTQENSKKNALSSKETVGKNSANLVLPKGLSNLGNTCFFNAVMQVLNQTHLLLRLFEAKCVKEMTLCIPEYYTNVKVNLDPINIKLADGYPLAQALTSFFKEMNSGGKSGTFSPSNLFSQVCKKAPQFRGMQQHDSHELLRHLMDSLKGDEIKRVQAGILRAFNFTEKVNPKTVNDETRKKLNAYGRFANHTTIDNIFSGQLISTVLCEECHKSSQVLEPFLDLCIPVTEDRPIRPSPHKKVAESEGTIIYSKSSSNETVSKHQEKKTMKQAKKMAKMQRKLGKSTGKCIMKVESPTANNANLFETVETEATEEDGTGVSNETSDKDSIDTEICDGDIEDNAETESSKSQLTTNAKVNGPAKDHETSECENNPAVDSSIKEIQGNNSLQDIDVDSSNELNEGVEDNLCNRIKDVQIREKPAGADAILDNNSTSAAEEASESDSFLNGEVEKTSDNSEQIKPSKQEWITRSLTTLTPRCQHGFQECSIQSSLNQFTAPELLIGVNKYGCENCTNKLGKSDGKKKEIVYTNASKQILILNPPAILTLHLKRFQQVGYGLRKDNRHVEFPLILDLAQYCSSVCLGLPNMKINQKKVIYSLYGVVHHSGRLSGGHYTAYIKVRPQQVANERFLNRSQVQQDEVEELLEKIHEKLEEPIDENFDTSGKWYHISDSHVSEASESAVLKSQAYLLFYERVH